MKPAWKVITKDNQTYTVYESSALKCIKQMLSDGFNEKDIRSVSKIKKEKKVIKCKVYQALKP